MVRVLMMVAMVMGIAGWATAQAEQQAPKRPVHANLQSLLKPPAAVWPRQGGVTKIQVENLNIWLKENVVGDGVRMRMIVKEVSREGDTVRILCTLGNRVDAAGAAWFCIFTFDVTPEQANAAAGLAGESEIIVTGTIDSAVAGNSAVGGHYERAHMSLKTELSAVTFRAPNRRGK